MKIVPLDREHLDYHRSRVNALTPESRRLWGKMDAAQMVAHLRASVAKSVDDRDVVDRSIPIVRSVGRWLLFDTFTTWPKGRFPSAPEMLPAHPGNLEEERRGLLEAFDRFVTEAEHHPDRKTKSPILGPTAMRYWTHVHGVHLNHHYRQFGLV